MPTTEDPLTLFLNFADAVQANADHARRPAYTETCVCGASVEVGKDVSRADLRRIHANFLGRHINCLPSTGCTDPDRPEGHCCGDPR